MLRIFGECHHAAFLKSDIGSGIIRIDAQIHHLRPAIAAVAWLNAHAVHEQAVDIVGADLSEHGEMIGAIAGIVVAECAEEVGGSVSADHPAFLVKAKPAHVADRLFMVESDIDVRADSDVLPVARCQQVAEHVAFHAGIGDADFCRVIGKTDVAAGKRVDVVHMGVFQGLRENGCIPFAVEIADAGHGVEIQVYGAFHRSHDFCTPLFKAFDHVKFVQERADRVVHHPEFL